MKTMRTAPSACSQPLYCHPNLATTASTSSHTAIRPRYLVVRVYGHVVGLVAWLDAQRHSTMNLGVVPQPVVPVPALVLTASPRRDETFCRFDVLPFFFFFFFSAICKSPSAIVDPIHCLAYHVADKREPLVPGPDRSGAKETFQAFAWEKPRCVEYPSFGERFPSFGKKPGHLITWHPCGPHVLLHAQQLSTECIYSSALLRCCGAAACSRAAVTLPPRCLGYIVTSL